jgi:hypothetical protein
MTVRLNQPPASLSNRPENMAWLEQLARIVNSRIVSGTAAERPTEFLYPFRPYGDTTLGKPLWRNADNTGWLAGDYVIAPLAFGYTTNVAIGDGAYYVVIPSTMNGLNLTRVHARVITAGTTGTTDIQIANVTDSVDMLSTKLTIDSGETGSDTAAVAAVIDTTKDDVATNDLLRIDVDAVSTTPPQGLLLTMEFGVA